MANRSEIWLKVCAGVMILGVAVWAAEGRAQPAPPYLGRLHSDLQLSPSQEDAWNTFQQSYRVDPQEIARERDADSRMAGLTGPQRMDLAISMAQQDLDSMRRRGDALKAFYATLTPQQQRVFDRDTLGPGPQRNY